ncbi:glycosyl hydrolase 53 family protein [Paenibacillus sp. IB182496]|uniref:Arabinogalactan endo-beta-1,4-galactanase n=1 Tax=Paenibacillus sabuli TaxID=2772509 RepID=A0A927BXA4_9BACL|nr:glycosyl hydrolase 53 family protein [Paenibacillus sabuli]MBD2847189.1 glycosyl hydrolase 53 family protein [Paenibacillus sabuli]
MTKPAEPILPFLKGADISFVDEIEREGGAFYAHPGAERDVLDILRESGVNSARLRLWNNPEFDYCNLPRTLRMARRIKDKGLHFLLDFHYSDYWADPSKQHMPKVWRSLAFPQLLEAVETFTRTCLRELEAAGALPDMVQVGNEITSGMVWPAGRVDGEHDTPQQWERLAALIEAGVRGVRAAAAETGRPIPVMIHIDRGGDNAGSRRFYDRLAEHGIDYDVIGLSYYSWWHGTLDEFSANMTDLATRYRKPIVVVEVAYPWTMTPPDEQPLIFNTEEWLYPGYPPTPDGQHAWLRELMRRIREVPHGLGRGLYYWEPCWIPSKPTWSVGHENNWSNLTLFDYAGRKLPSLDAFRE